MQEAAPPIDEQIPVLRLVNPPRATTNVQLPPPLPPPLPVEIREVDLATKVLPPPLPVGNAAADYASASTERPPPVPAEILAAVNKEAKTGDTEALGLDMVCLPELFCPKCKALIPESHQGAFFTACPKCGEIIKMK